MEKIVFLDRWEKHLKDSPKKAAGSQNSYASFIVFLF